MTDDTKGPMTHDPDIAGRVEPTQPAASPRKGGTAVEKPATKKQGK